MKMKRIDSLQGLRAIAFISVFLGHCGIGGGGSMGVSVFLVLSGFLMIYNYWNREPKSGVKENFLFSLKKIRKLYPLHIVMLMPMLVLKGYGEIVDGSFRTSMQFVLQILADFFLVQAWVPFREFYFSFNGVAWYLSVCVFLYFVFPFFLKWMKRKYKLYTAILTIVIIFFTQTILSNFAATNIGSAIVYNNLWFTYIFPVFRLGDFLIGCCLGYIFLQNTSINVSN